MVRDGTHSSAWAGGHLESVARALAIGLFPSDGKTNSGLRCAAGHTDVWPYPRDVVFEVGGTQISLGMVDAALRSVAALVLVRRVRQGDVRADVCIGTRVRRFAEPRTGPRSWRTGPPTAPRSGPVLSSIIRAGLLRSPIFLSLAV